MIHFDDVTFNAVATPFCANDLVPVVVELAKVSVSELIAIDKACEVSFTNVTVAPTGNAIVPLAGIVKVLVFVSAAG